MQGRGDMIQPDSIEKIQAHTPGYFKKIPINRDKFCEPCRVTYRNIYIKYK